MQTSDFIFGREEELQTLEQRLLKGKQFLFHGPTGVSRYLHKALTFIVIAAEELKPRYMRGYGQISPEVTRELNRIASELVNLTTESDRYVTRETRTQMHSPEEEFSKNERNTTT
jgi:hypothetical protein